MTLRLFVQPVDGHGVSAVSGMSREDSGPEARNWSSTRRRNPSLAASQSTYFAYPCGQSAISAR